MYPNFIHTNNFKGYVFFLGKSVKFSLKICRLHSFGSGVRNLGIQYIDTLCDPKPSRKIFKTLISIIRISFRNWKSYLSDLITWNFQRLQLEIFFFTFLATRSQHCCETKWHHVEASLEVFVLRAWKKCQRDLNFKLLWWHPPYGPNLFLCNFHWKKRLKVTFFSRMKK